MHDFDAENDIVSKFLTAVPIHLFFRICTARHGLSAWQCLRGAYSCLKACHDAYLPLQRLHTTTSQVCTCLFYQPQQNRTKSRSISSRGTLLTGPLQFGGRAASLPRPARELPVRAAAVFDPRLRAHLAEGRSGPDPGPTTTEQAPVWRLFIVMPAVLLSCCRGACGRS